MLRTLTWEKTQISIIARLSVPQPLRETLQTSGAPRNTGWKPWVYALSLQDVEIEFQAGGCSILRTHGESSKELGLGTQEVGLLDWLVPRGQQNGDGNQWLRGLCCLVQNLAPSTLPVRQ